MPEHQPIEFYEGATPSMADLRAAPPHALLTTAQASSATGLGRATLHTYGSLRRSGRFLGPRPTRLPGARVLYYSAGDVLAWADRGETGAER